LQVGPGLIKKGFIFNGLRHWKKKRYASEVGTIVVLALMRVSWYHEMVLLRSKSAQNCIFEGKEVKR
jgi:hypothetical protein